MTRKLTEAIFHLDRITNLSYSFNERKPALLIIIYSEVTGQSGRLDRDFYAQTFRHRTFRGHQLGAKTFLKNSLFEFLYF